MEDKSLRRTSNSQTKEIEKKETEKYVKYFVLKSFEAVIMSRNGRLNKTKCNASAKGQDWFNISMPDSETNKILQFKTRELFGKKTPSLSHPAVLDIILKTSEGTYIVLESWQISIDVKNSYDKSHFSIYNQLGLMVKSVLVITKALPAFVLSRRIEKDFSLFYKVHTEIYPLNQFELDNSICLGKVNAPIGKLMVNVMFRNTVSLTGLFHPHAYRIKYDTESLVPLLSERESAKGTFESIDLFKNEIALAVADTSNNIMDTYSGAAIGHENGSKSVAAFVEPCSLDDLNSLDLPKLPPTPPFQSLFQDPDLNVEIDMEDCIPTEGVKRNIPSKENTIVPRHAEAVGFEDDFVLVELRPAFISEDESVGNLYRKCLSPQPLEIFSSLEHEDQESELIDLETQLERYQKEIQEYSTFFEANLN